MRGARPLTRGELYRVLRGDLDPRVRHLVVLMAYAGLRVGECLALDWQGIYVFLGSAAGPRSGVAIRRCNAKGRRSGRWVPMAATLWDGTERYLGELADVVGPGTPLYRSARGTRWSRQAATAALRRAFDGAGLPDISAHSCRKLFATSLRDRGEGLDTVRVLLGHADLRTTRDYLGDVPQAVLVAAIEGQPSEDPCQ